MGAMTRRDVHDLIADLKARGAPFVLATVVRTVSRTAAKAGAKAVIGADGVIHGGWIGGGCARGAVLRAAREALADGAPRLVSVRPEDVLAAEGLEPGQTREGIRYARSLCPSKGTMDVFVEPMLPRPAFVVMGASPVASALAELAPRFGFEVTLCAPPGEAPATAPTLVGAGEPVQRVEGYDPQILRQEGPRRRFVVVATQGRGDEAALGAALAAGAEYTAFVGSQAKVAALRERALARMATDAEARAALAAGFERLHAPAGLDIGAITPEEIALSILAQAVAILRTRQRAEEERPHGAAC